MARAKVSIDLEIDEELINDFFQHLREFDTRFPDRMHFDVLVHERDKPVSEVVKELTLDPPLPFTQIIKRRQ